MPENEYAATGTRFLGALSNTVAVFVKRLPPAIRVSAPYTIIGLVIAVALSAAARALHQIPEGEWSRIGRGTHILPTTCPSASLYPRFAILL